MILNSQSLIDLGIVTGDIEPNQIQQVGIDLTIKSVNEVRGVGKILKNETILPQYIEIEPEEWGDGFGWRLQPGYYEITLNEGCDLSKVNTAKIRQRSSLSRSGAQIHSPLFDPGFSTFNIGTFMIVSRTIFIEKGSRVCQFYVDENEEATPYNGQFQNDKQREDEE